MAKVKWGTSLDETAVRTAQEYAEAAGVPIGEWVAAAIRVHAMRTGTRALYDALDADPDLAQEWASRGVARREDTESLLHRPDQAAA